MIASNDSRLMGGVSGWQAPVQGTLLTVGGTPVTSDVSSPVTAILPLAGATLGAGTYYFAIPVAGCSAVDVVLRTSSGGANVTAASSKLYRTLVDYVTEKMGPTGTSAAVVAGTFTDTQQQTISVTGLRGEQSVLLKLVLTGSATFDQAEYSAL